MSDNHEMKHLSVKEFAERVSYSERQITRLIKEGKIKNDWKISRKWLIAESELASIGNRRVAPWKQEHYNWLAEIASSLIAGNLASVEENPPRDKDDPFSILRYTIIEGGYGYGITHDQLAGLLHRNIDWWVENEPIQFTHFMSHLRAEYTELESESLDSVVEEKPLELIRILERLAPRKEFKGTCDVCQNDC